MNRWVIICWVFFFPIQNKPPPSLVAGRDEDVLYILHWTIALFQEDNRFRRWKRYSPLERYTVLEAVVAMMCTRETRLSLKDTLTVETQLVTCSDTNRFPWWDKTWLRMPLLRFSYQFEYSEASLCLQDFPPKSRKSARFLAAFS